MPILSFRPPSFAAAAFGGFAASRRLGPAPLMLHVAYSLCGVSISFGGVCWGTNECLLQRCVEQGLPARLEALRTRPSQLASTFLPASNPST